MSTTSELIQQLPDGTHIQFRWHGNPENATFFHTGEWDEYGWVKRNGDWYSLELEAKGIHLPDDFGRLFGPAQWDDDGTHWIDDYEYRVVRTP